MLPQTTGGIALYSTRYGTAALPQPRVFVVEAEPDAQHQVVRGLEILEAVAHMHERIACDTDLERQHLVKRLEVSSLVQYVETQSEADREIGHHELGAGRDAERQLLVDAGFLHRKVGAAAHLYDLVGDGDVGAAVVDAVQRETRAEFITEVVHRREVEARHAVGVGRSVLLVADLHTLAAPRSEQHQIVAQVAGKGFREQPCPWPRERVVDPSETVYEPEFHADRVESRVGEFGVAVRKVGHRKARGEFQPLREQPVEVEIDVEVGVDPRPHHDVGAVVVRVVGFPSERQAEIPLVVERQPPAYPRDARPLENIKRHGAAQLLPVFETVVGDPDSLIGASVYPVGTRSGLEAERVAQVGGDGPKTVHLMSHLLGAYERVQSQYSADAYREFGMQYQWGRKDPFPAHDVRVNKNFYDGSGKLFDFLWEQRGNDVDYGKTDAQQARGAALTMKQSIEHPNAIVSHQSFWLYECFPHGLVNNFKDRWVFLYPWNKPSAGNPEDVGGKTVFDPSPYGFRIMSQKEAVTLRFAYYYASYSGLNTPLPGSIYDGSFLHNATGGNEAIFAVAQAKSDTHAGRYLLNSTGGPAGWAPTSNTSAVYRRCMTYSVRPVIDPDVQEDYKKYLPE